MKNIQFMKNRIKKPALLTYTLSALLPLSFILTEGAYADNVVPPVLTNVAASAGLVTTRAVRGVGWGDFNADGCPDALVATQTGTLLFRNECNGTFTDVSAAAGITDTINGWSAVWADYDGDNDMDAFITNGSGTGNKLYRNNGNSTFTEVAAAAGVAGAQGFAGAAFADYDGDGDLDVFVAGRFDPPVDLTDRLYQNNGNGTFTEVSGVAGVAGTNSRKTFMGAWFDYDNDNDLDLYVSVDFGNDTLYRNNGGGNFTDVGFAAGIGQPQHGMGVAIGDINHDGCLDIASTNNGMSDPNEAASAEHGPSALYINNCNGTFTNTPLSAGLVDRGMIEWGINFQDVDYDSDLDLAVVSGGMMSSGQPNALLISNGESFVDTTITSGIGTSIGASFGSAWADFDGDGDLDWLIGNEAGGIALYRNDGPTGNYLKVKVVGAGMNTQGIGARINLRSGMRLQTRQLQAGLSYVSSEEPIAVFGLGTRSTADEVKVSFPGGVVTLTDVAANQTIEITEPAAPTCVVGTPGSVAGKVTNTTTGLGEPGVQVGLRSTVTQATVSTTTDSAGNYTFSSVATGASSIVYRLTASKALFIGGKGSASLDCGQAVTVDMNVVPQ